jgi:hypothetical protein
VNAAGASAAAQLGAPIRCVGGTPAALPRAQGKAMKTSNTSSINPATSHRLDTIAKRQRDARKRDLLFACCVALAALIGATTVGAAAHAAVPIVLVQH